jgi:hypothetical protein
VLQERWSREEEEEERHAAKVEAQKKMVAEAVHKQRASKDMHAWKARARYMQSADAAAARAIKTAAKEVRHQSALSRLDVNPTY